MRTYLLFLLACCLGLSSPDVFGQRFKSASYFMGDEAEDNLLSSRRDLIQSKELALGRSVRRGNQPGTDNFDELDSWLHVMDYNLVPSDPAQSIGGISNYIISDPDPYPAFGTPNYDWRKYAEARYVAGDWDGDGVDDIMRVIQNETGELLIYQENTLEVLAPGEQRSTDISNAPLLARIPRPTSTYRPLPLGQSNLRLLAVPSLADERDMLALGCLYHIDSSLYEIHLTLFQDQVIDTFIFPFQFIGVGALSPNSELYINRPAFDLEVIDMELDDAPEIVLAFGANPLDVSGNPDPRMELRVMGYDSTQLIRRRSHQMLNNTYPAVGLDLEAGDFDGDLAPELALAYMVASTPTISFLFAHDMRGWIIHAVDDSLKPGISMLDTLITYPEGRAQSLHRSWHGIAEFFSAIRSLPNIKAGDIDGDGKDELVTTRVEFYERDNLASIDDYEVRTLVPYLEGFDIEVNDTSGGPAREMFHYSFPRNYNTPYIRRYIPQNTLEVANLDGSGKDEIAIYFPYTTNTSPSQSNGDYARDNVIVYHYTAGGIDTLARYDRPGFTSDGTLTPPANRYRSIELLVGDFDGDGIRLGKPRFFRKTDISQPLVVLNAPPVHFDTLAGQNFDVNDCFQDQVNGGPNDGDCDFYTGYTVTTSQQFSAETQFTSSWTTSSSLSSSTNVYGNKLEAELTETYGESFSNYQGAGKSIQITEALRTGVDDRVLVQVLEYGVFEYPVYEGDSLLGHFITINPELDASGPRWINSKDGAAKDYMPLHEVGNILSYRDIGNRLGAGQSSGIGFVDHMIGYEGNQVSISSQSGSYQWQATFADFQSQQTSFSNSLSVGSSVSATVGAEINNFGSSITASVSGNYSQENTSAYSTELSNSIQMDVKLGEVDNLQADYVVQPFFYWGKNGALVIDYSVRPGSGSNFWTVNYGQEADPALILPWRLDPERGITLAEEITRLQSKSITYQPKDAQPGDEVTLYAAIHNYSLLPTSGPVEVAFYLGNPNCPGSQRLTNLNGLQSVFTGTPIAPQGRQVVSFRWRLPQNISTQPRIFVLVDPEENMTEINEGNNLGFTTLDVIGTGPTPYCNVITEVEEPLVQTARPSVRAFPNPFSSVTQLEFYLPGAAQVELSVFDLNGRQVAQLVSDFLPAGTHSHTFDAKHLPDGLYVYRLRADELTQSGKLSLQR